MGKHKKASAAEGEGSKQARDRNPNWNVAESMLLLELKKKELLELEAVDDIQEKMVPACVRWDHISGEMKKRGVNRLAKACCTRWDLMQHSYKRILDHDQRSGKPAYFDLPEEERPALKLQMKLTKEMYKRIKDVLACKPNMNLLSLRDTSQPERSKERSRAPEHSSRSEGSGYKATGEEDPEIEELDIQSRQKASGHRERASSGQLKRKRKSDSISEAIKQGQEKQEKITEEAEKLRMARHEELMAFERARHQDFIRLEEQRLADERERITNERDANAAMNSNMANLISLMFQQQQQQEKK